MKGHGKKSYEFGGLSNEEEAVRVFLKTHQLIDTSLLLHHRRHAELVVLDLGGVVQQVRKRQAGDDFVSAQHAALR